MASMRKEAEDTYNGKLDRMGLGIQTATTGPKGNGHQRSVADGSDGMASGSRAKGYATEEANEATLAEKAPKKLRLDRKEYAHGGAVSGKKKSGTTVNVIVAPQGGPPAGGPPPMPEGPPPMPMPPPHMAPPPGPPGGGMPMPGGGGPAPMMRKHGGVVRMKDGAGGGLGRLEKVRKYGDNAKEGAD